MKTSVLKKNIKNIFDWQPLTWRMTLKRSSMRVNSSLYSSAVEQTLLKVLTRLFEDRGNSTPYCYETSSPCIPWH